MSFSVYQGDSTPSLQVKPAITIDDKTITGDWVCKSSLIRKSDGTVIVPSRVESTISDSLDSWLLKLKPDDTVLVEVTKRFTRCVWVIEVSNSSLDYRKEQHIDVNVKKQALI